MTAITVEDLDNAKLDVDLIAAVATSTEATAVDRLGNMKLTVAGAMQALAAINPRGAWVTATAYAIKDVFSDSGLVYITVRAHTSTTVAADLAAGKIALYQAAITQDIYTFTGGVDFTAGFTTSLTLPRAPGSEGNLIVHFDGAFQGPEEWNVSGTTVTFTNPIPTGTAKVYAQVGVALFGSEPPPGSVATDSIADESVTDAKIAAGTSLYNRITRIYDIRDPEFGAVCDGVTDDAAAINDAEATIAAAGGGILKFPPGTIIAGSELVKRGNVIWQGAGIGATVIKAKAGSTMNALVATLNAYSLFGTSSISGEFAFGLRDITLDGNKDGGAACDGLAIYGATFSLDNYEITNCTGHGLRTEFGIPGAIPHGYNAQSNSNNALIHDCDIGGVRWDGPPDPSLNNNNIYRNLNYNFKNGVNGTGCKLVNCHVWGSSFDSRQAATGIQLNTPGNLIVNTVSEGATTHQIHLRSNGNVIVGGNIYYFSDALALVYGITIGDIGAAITSADNVIKTKIDNCGLGAIYFNNNGGGNDIEVTGRFSITAGIGFSGSTGTNDYLKMRFLGTGVVNGNITVEPNASVFLPGFGGGGGQVSVGAADSGGTGYRVLRVPN